MSLQKFLKLPKFSHRLMFFSFSNIYRLFLFQVELFCVNHLINCSLESTEEFIAMELRFTLRDNGMRAAFQLLHMVLEVILT